MSAEFLPETIRIAACRLDLSDADICYVLENGTYLEFDGHEAVRVRIPDYHVKQLKETHCSEDSSDARVYRLIGVEIELSPDHDRIVAVRRGRDQPRAKRNYLGAPKGHKRSRPSAGWRGENTLLQGVNSVCRL